MECNKCVSIDTGRQKEIQISSRFSPAVFQADCPCCSSDVLHVELDAPRQPATRHLSLQFQADNTLVSWVQGAKRHFLRHLYIKSIILPRQARDKHRERALKKEEEWRFLRVQAAPAPLQTRGSDAP